MASTTHLGLNLPLGTESADQDALNENFQVLDDEVFRRGKTINGTEADENGNFVISEVPFARNLITDKEQSSGGEYTYRTTGGDASISDGTATLVRLQGRSIHEGETDEILDLFVNSPREQEEDEISAAINRDTFVAYVENPAEITVVLTYTDAWSANPTLYGITVTGTPAEGDTITVNYVRADRGTITPARPTRFASTGWNLYDAGAGYAHVKRYSEEYGFAVGGTYAAIQFSETPTGPRVGLTVVGGKFTVPGDGYVFVTGGNSTDTCVYMTWSDWVNGHEGEWEGYTEDSIDLTAVMRSQFPFGLCRIGSVYDEIDVANQTAVRRIGRMNWSEAAVQEMIDSGTVYDADATYIYYVLPTPNTAAISVVSQYSASDHGMEIVGNDSAVEPFVQTLYGENLVDKLRKDVLTISTQLLTEAQKTQVQENIGAAGVGDLNGLASEVSAIRYTAITEGTNLNNIRTPGFYGVATSTIARTLVNCPVTGNFTMIAMNKSSANRTHVIITASAIYVRTTTSGAFGPWYKYQGTVVE